MVVRHLMSIEQVFTKERDRYVEFLVETRNRIGQEFPKTVGELLISINNESIPYPYRYVRVDVMSMLPDGTSKPCEVKLNIDPLFEATGFNFGSLVVEVYPFTWNSIQIVVDRPIPNIVQVEELITRWLDIEDKQPDSPLGLSQAIHSFTPVSNNDEYWYLTGDFGSAPIDALIDFIELLAEQGIARIVLKSGE